MSASAAEGVITGADDLLLLHHHSLLCHVPQHSRREKLRFQPDNSSLLPSVSYANAHYVGDSSLFQTQLPQACSLTLSPTVSPLPLGPFTGYAAVLNRSRFLGPALQILDEIYDFSCRGALAVASACDLPELISADHEVGEEEHRLKKAGLISMIDEVCRRYRLYCQQVQTVITSFEMVSGLSTAAPYVSLAIKSMAKHFMYLKNAMSNQLNHINKAPAKEGFGRMDIPNVSACPPPRENNSDVYRQPHIWRPQRGLPEHAVAVLRAWLFDHFLHPYPTDVDKQLLAKKTGLTRSQVSNWFINARVRLWKPMVEDIHNLELRQLQKTVLTAENEISISQPSQRSLSIASSSGNIPRNQTLSSKHYSNHELAYIPQPIVEPYNCVDSDLASQSLGVSLTLGLPQNNTLRLTAQPLTLGFKRRFGVEDCDDDYVVGKSIGGHLL